MKRIIGFFGGVTFAAILMALFTVVILIATFVEGHTSSHEVAVELVYNHFLFNVLLGGFFLNILLSTLASIPVQNKTYPFHYHTYWTLDAN